MPYPRFRISMTIPEVLRSVFDAFGTGDNLAPVVFARALKSFGGYNNIVMTGSGRAGFRLLLESLNLPPGSEIIFPAYTFHIMPVVAAECGLKPVFADVDPETWNIDPEKIIPLINKNTRVIMPTHLFGVPADMEKIGQIAWNNNLLLFEDCAHALGALDGDGPVGNKGDAALFTFAMSKNMPCWGGGAIVVRDGELAERMLGRIDTREVPSARSILRRQISNIPGIILTQRGIFPWTLYPVIRLADLKGSNYFDRPFIEEVRGPEGSNQLSVISNQFLKDSNQLLEDGNQLAVSSEQYAFDADPGSRITGATAAGKNRITGISPFQATVGLRQLKRFPGWLNKQVRNARLLRGLLKDCPGIQLQQEPEGTSSSFLYVRARVDDPPAVRRRLLRAGIDTKPDDMRNCAALKIFGSQISCPVAEKLGGHCIELPCSHFYFKPQIDQIADRIIDAL
ncbi:MAG: aminotransferase class I/II-fold pyridoxal phosphate-dependent enzyme [Candidatus Auribacterota bacterium]|nr:aminotransferase class I/II-fold pyridoxal phosphate-dependent enzyme [Candidatus Auribacterota bacterium]